MIILYGVFFSILLSMIITFFVFLSMIGSDYLKAYKTYYLLFTKKVFCYYYIPKASIFRGPHFFYSFDSYLFIKIGNSNICRYYINETILSDRVEDLTFDCPYLTFLNFILSKKFKKLEKKDVDTLDELKTNIAMTVKKENRQNRLKNILK